MVSSARRPADFGLPQRTGRGPVVVAHRGSQADFAEHTLPGYRRAINEGADALECDVRLTADGHVVCVHDRRIDRTSTGSGIVSALTLDELERHDFGSWWTSDDVDEAPEVDPDRSRVLTLERLLRLILDADRPIGLAIETKHPNRYAGYLEQRVVETLEIHGLARPPRDSSSRVQIMSFSEIAMRRLRIYAPGVPRVFLMETLPLRFRAGVLPFHTRVAGPSIEVIRKYPEYVRRAHANGNQVHVWTVDRLDDVEMCVELGVDGLISNRPGAVVRHLAKLGVRPAPESDAPTGK